MKVSRTRRASRERSGTDVNECSQEPVPLKSPVVARRSARSFLRSLRLRLEELPMDSHVYQQQSSVNVPRDGYFLLGVETTPLAFALAHERQHLLAELLRLLLEVQEGGEDKVDAEGAEEEDAVRHLTSGTDELGLEAVL